MSGEGTAPVPPPYQNAYEENAYQNAGPRPPAYSDVFPTTRQPAVNRMPANPRGPALVNTNRQTVSAPVAKCPTFNCVLIENILGCLLCCPLLGCIGFIFLYKSKRDKNLNSLKSAHTLGLCGIFIGITLAIVMYDKYLLPY